jgi:hypothetical protein
MIPYPAPRPPGGRTTQRHGIGASCRATGTEGDESGERNEGENGCVREVGTINQFEESMMRWIVIVIAALFLLPVAWWLLKIVFGLATGLIQIALAVAFVIFLVGLIRRMMLVR